MSTLLYFLAGIGFLFSVYWVISFLYGNFASKEKVGFHYLKKRLKQNNIPLSTFSDEQILRVSKNALHGTLYGGAVMGRFNSVDFKDHLEYRIRLLTRYALKSPLDQDENRLIEILLKPSSPPSA